METFASTSGEIQTYIDGNLVKDIGYDAKYDGNVAEIHLRDNDEEYYTRLDKESLLKLLNSSHAKGDLMLRLKEEYPIVSTTKESKTKESKTKESKTKESKTKKEKREKREKREKKTRRKKK
jgi:hypothetical protein